MAAAKDAAERAKVGRNDPCPCGSGRKYKQCHLGKDDDPARRELPHTTEEVAVEAAQAPPLPAWTRAIPWIIGLGGGGTGLALWASQGPKPGIAVLAATGLVLLGWFLFRDPPPPKKDAGDPAGLDFGRR